MKKNTSKKSSEKTQTLLEIKRVRTNVKGGLAARVNGCDTSSCGGCWA